MRRVYVKHLTGDPPENPKAMTLIDFLIKKAVEQSMKDKHIERLRQKKE